MENERRMRKRYAVRKDNAKLYEVLVDNEVVFEGTAKEISEKYGIRYELVYQYIDRNIRYRWKYQIRFKGTFKRLYKLTNIKNNDTFIGTKEEIMQKFYVSETPIYMANRNETKLLGEWLVKEVTYEQSQEH